MKRIILFMILSIFNLFAKSVLIITKDNTKVSKETAHFIKKNAKKWTVDYTKDLKKDISSYDLVILVDGNITSGVSKNFQSYINNLPSKQKSKVKLLSIYAQESKPHLEYSKNNDVDVVTTSSLWDRAKGYTKKELVENYHIKWFEKLFK